MSNRSTPGGEHEAARLRAMHTWPDLGAAARPVAAADPPGERERALAVDYLREFIAHRPGTAMAPQREKAEACLDVLAAALRAGAAEPPGAAAGEWTGTLPAEDAAPIAYARAMRDTADWLRKVSSYGPYIARGEAFQAKARELDRIIDEVEGAAASVLPGGSQEPTNG